MGVNNGHKHMSPARDRVIAIPEDVLDHLDPDSSKVKHGNTKIKHKTEEKHEPGEISHNKYYAQGDTGYNVRQIPRRQQYCAATGTKIVLCQGWGDTRGPGPEHTQFFIREKQ